MSDAEKSTISLRCAVDCGGRNLQCVDVVVPCYNYGHFLQKCVGSILSQADVDVRVLILDDASPDNTADIGAILASNDKRVTFRRHEANKGHIATYNEGIDWASGDFFLLLSADDYLLPGALSRASQLMRSEPDVGFTFGNALVLLPDGSTERLDPFGTSNAIPRWKVLSGLEFIRLSGASNIVPTPTAVVRTSLQKRVGGYRRELPHAGDMEMWLRLASCSAVGFINDGQAVYRRHNANMSRHYFADSMILDLQQRNKACELLFSHGEVNIREDPELRRFLANDLAMAALRRAGVAFNRSDLAAAAAIQRFALEVSPEVRRSWPWAKLAFKQAIGPKCWHALNSVLRPSAGRHC